MKPTTALHALSLSCLLTINTADAAEYVMRISHSVPPAHRIAKAFDRFEQDVEKATAGRVDVQMFGSEQLFKGEKNPEAVASGKVEAAAVVSLMWNKTIPEMQVLSIPYLMSDLQKLRKFPDSMAAQMLAAEINDTGVYNLGWLIDSTDSVFTSNGKPLIRPEDYQGLKIRGLGKMFDTGLTVMGAQPATMSGAEVYPALKAGTIEAGVTSVDAAHARRFYEVQSYAVVTPLMAVFQNLIVNPQWWNGLPADIQTSIQDAIGTMETALTPASEISPEAVAQLQADGMTVHVHSNAEVEALKAVMQPAVISVFEASSDMGAEIVQLIQTM